MTLVEIALDDIVGARIAELAGAGRVELCGSLAENGGTTPSLGFVREVVEQVDDIPLVVLVRPRGGDFVYSPDELRVMVRDLAALRDLDAGIGFVVGALTPDGAVDSPALLELLAAAEGAPVTFHRAIDSTRDLIASVDLVAEMGVHRVLSSGGRRTALDGVRTLRSLIERTAGRLTVVVGGSVRPENAARIVSETGATEIHLRAAFQRTPQENWSNPEQDYGSARVSATDGRIVRAVVTAVAGARA
ncbi:copper homeostasis protein CutC [Humibacter antri]